LDDDGVIYQKEQLSDNYFEVKMEF